MMQKLEFYSGALNSFGHTHKMQRFSDPFWGGSRAPESKERLQGPNCKLLQSFWMRPGYLDGFEASLLKHL